MTARRFILGTAGHVDHGKTELVKSLTGWDTDRLKEEKERGISIELGFAPLRLGDDTIIGIVDVPGHERFVKNMVAGAGGIDMAMLVIAADEGVMPQTREHMEVLRSLSVSTGVVAVSKIDLAGDDLAAMVMDDVAELVRGTFLEDAPVVTTSVKTGEGLGELKKVLRGLTEKVPSRDATGPFRLAVDRVFHKQGIGVVVTGSCYSGTLSIGDGLELLPSKKPVRVREIQSFGEGRETGYAGERLAIALQGIKPPDVGRGDMIVTPSKFVVSYMLDARLHIAVYGKFRLKHRERVRIHHGAREVLGRVVLLEQEELRSGDSSLVQMRLEKPIVAGEGDFFVVRKYSPARVLGGGRIIDPRAAKHRLRDPAAVRNLRLAEGGDPKEKLIKAVENTGLNGVDKNEFDEGEVRELIEAGDIMAIEGRLFHRTSVQELGEEICELARAYVAAHPLRIGIDKEELRQKVRFPHPAPLFNRVLEAIGRFRDIRIIDNRVRTDSGEAQLPPELSAELDRLERIIKESGLLFQRQSDIAKRWGGTSNFSDAFQYLRGKGVVHKIAEDGYVHQEHLSSCVRRLIEWFDENATLSVPEFKDLFGLTRKHAVPLLEHLDAAKMTVRRESVRVRGPNLADSRDRPASETDPR